jgi:hypothetical protein
MEASNTKESSLSRRYIAAVSHIRSLTNDFRRWLHAGEQGAVVVYSKPFGWRLLFQGSITVSWLLIPSLHRLPILPIVMGALMLPRTLAEGRRAIIFTQTEIIYRPPFARPCHFTIGCIQRIKRRRVTVYSGLEPSPVPGVAMTLASGVKELLPLDFKDRAEILRRLSSVTGKAIEE